MNFLRSSQENACARCMLKACVCCLWCLEKCLAYLNQVSEGRKCRILHGRNEIRSIYSVHVTSFQNAYTATAINSTSFCTSARDAFVILVENALRVAAINTVGDFVLFLGKVPHRHIVMFFLSEIIPQIKQTLMSSNSNIDTLRCLSSPAQRLQASWP